MILRMQTKKIEIGLRIEDMVKEDSMSLNYIKFYKPRNNPSKFESHSRRYIREFIHNIFVYRDQILPERSYYMSEQKLDRQKFISDQLNTWFLILLNFLFTSSLFWLSAGTS